MELESIHFEKIRAIFEDILKKKGYIDFSEVCGDQTEDFCKEILNKLDEFYGNT